MEETVATICVSLQLTTTPGVLPSQTLPLPCVAPNPEPVMVTCVPATPVDGDTFEIVAVFTVKGTTLENNPFSSTWAFPDVEMGATVATICISVQLTTVAGALPSQTIPPPCGDPKPAPVMVTCVPDCPEVGETAPMLGVAGPRTVTDGRKSLRRRLPKSGGRDSGPPTWLSRAAKSWVLTP